MAIATLIKDTPVHVGDTVRVHYKIIERDIVAGKTKRAKEVKKKERVQAFEGIVIRIKGARENQTFTVRRIGSGSIGIERIIPVLSPWIAKLEVKKHGDVRRSKLYYLRLKQGKQAEKIKEKSTQKVKAQGKKLIKTKPRSKSTPTNSDDNAKQSPPKS